MAEARTDLAWAQTSAILALIANVHRPRKMRAFTPADFNPVAKDRDEHQGKADIQMLKRIFVKERTCDTPSDNSPSTGSRGPSEASSS